MGVGGICVSVRLVPFPLPLVHTQSKQRMQRRQYFNPARVAEAFTLLLPLLQPGTQIVVHGLPYRTSWQDLKDMCRWVG